MHFYIGLEFIRFLALEYPTFSAPGTAVIEYTPQVPTLLIILRHLYEI